MQFTIYHISKQYNMDGTTIYRYHPYDFFGNLRIFFGIRFRFPFEWAYKFDSGASRCKHFVKWMHDSRLTKRGASRLAEKYNAEQVKQIV